MKKIILLFTLLTGCYFAQAQCVPNAKTTAGNGYIIPDSATGMVHACAGMAYDETFYIKVPKDTTIFIVVNGKFDSVVINVDPTTIGLPTYINNITTNPPTQLPNTKHPFKHIKINRKASDSLACIRLQGTVPAGTAASTTALNIPFAAYLKLTVGGFPYPLGTTGDSSIAASYSSYKFIIDPAGSGACALGINSINTNINAVQIVPNPSATSMSVNVMATKPEPVTVSILNTIGQTLASKNTTLVNGANYIPFDVSALAAGVYIYNISNKNGQTVSGRFVKN
jgi:hypothetical protein